MDRHTALRTGIIVAGLAALFTAGIAVAQSPPRVGSGDVFADRVRLMKLNGASLQDLQAKAKADNIEAIAVNAETIALNAMHIPLLFPPGSIPEKSRAKPEIWQRWAEFEAAAKNLQVQAEQLRDAARAKNAAAVQEMVKTFPKQACGACHTARGDGTSFGPIYRSMQ